MTTMFFLNNFFKFSDHDLKNAPGKGLQILTLYYPEVILISHVNFLFFEQPIKFLLLQLFPEHLIYSPRLHIDNVKVDCFDFESL